MKFRSHVDVNAHPDVKLRWRVPPLGFAAEGDGALQFSTGPIDVEVGSIPIALRIPFHRGRVHAATVGPFHLRVRPATATIRACGVRAGGSVGGGDVQADLAGHCRAEVSARGERDVEDDPCATAT